MKINLNTFDMKQAASAKNTKIIWFTKHKDFMQVQCMHDKIQIKGIMLHWEGKNIKTLIWLHATVPNNLNSMNVLLMWYL